jgi:hypothetical protein
MAERERFELSVPCDTHAFQACALDHYATSPRGIMVILEPLEAIGPMAEGEGFEPPMGCPIPVFETGALGHYATPPEAICFVLSF